jgi:hypothetical protein
LYLNEVITSVFFVLALQLNKVITSISFPHTRHGSGIDDEEWLTTERMAKWIEDNHVLQIILRDSLHQPQYVEKLEKIIRFAIKEKALTTEDLDTIWAAQVGKHEAIVKNVHDLLAKLAWDFSPDQLDQLFECFQVTLLFIHRTFWIKMQGLKKFKYSVCRRVGATPTRNSVKSCWS